LQGIPRITSLTRVFAPSAKFQAPEKRSLKKNRSSDNLVDSGVEIQPSAEEQDPDSKVSKSTKTASSMFQALDLGVKALRQGIGDRVPEIG
jgi:hypothetical protein